MSRKPFVIALVGGLVAAVAGTASAQNRVSASQKGSLLIYSKIEIKWDSAGNLIQDTFLDIANDHPDAVRVHGYLINGDEELEQICGGEPPTNPDGSCSILIQAEEPGWNTANCSITLTGNQPSWWSAAQGFGGAFANQSGVIGGFSCQPFTVLDNNGDGTFGRPDFEQDPENPGWILRGYAVFWAQQFFDDVGDNGTFLPIRWNHLKGDAVIVNYENGTAWEYNAWAFRAHNVPHGQATTTGPLLLDGIMYDAPYSTLLLDFYGTGSDALSGGGSEVVVNTDLTLHAVSLDVRQDGCGPVLTKAVAEIYNEFETKFSGTERCICCWDQTMLDDWVRSVAVPNHFTRSALRTDKGKARLTGLGSDRCDYETLCGPTAAQKRRNCSQGPVVFESEDAALLGLATKFLTFDETDEATAGMNLVGMGERPAIIWYDIMTGSPELRDGTDGRATPARDKTGARDNTTSDRGALLRTQR